MSPTPTSPFGGGIYCYWVIANYAIGHSTPSAPGCTGPIVGGSVVVNWNTVSGALSYDVLRTATPILPSVPSAIAVSTGVSAPPLTDNFGALSSYTINTTSPASATFLLDNQNQAAPQVKVSIVNAASVNTFTLGAGGGGGGTGNAAAVVVVPFSATPTFTCPSSSAGTVVDFQAASNAPIILTGNITSSTLSTCTSGADLNFLLKQDATGGRTVAMPAGFDSCPVHLAPNVTTKCSYYFDGANGRLLGAVSDAGYSQAAEGAAPAANPVSGNEYFNFDSTRHTATVLNSSGNLHIVPKTACLTDQLCAQDTTGVEFCTGGGSANAQTAACTPVNQSLVTGLTVKWLPSAGNTAATTLGVDSLTVKNLTKCGTTALASGDLTTAAVAIATYDGTQFQLLNAQSTGGGCGAGGGGGGTTLSTQGSGYVYPFGIPSSRQTGSAQNVNAVVVWQFVCCSGVSIKIRHISWAFDTVTASASVKWAIYSDSAGAANLLSTSDALSVAANNNVEQFQAWTSAPTLNQGTVYWLAITGDTANWHSPYEGCSNGLICLDPVNEPSFGREYVCVNTSSGTGSGITMPATCGGVGSGLGARENPSVAFLP